MEQAKQQYLEKAVHDCSFVVGKTPADTKVIKSYKSILASASPVFERMFNGSFLESRRPDGIEITDADAVDFEMFLQYIIHGGASLVICPKLTKLNIYCLVRKYAIEEMKQEIWEGVVGTFKSSDPCYVLVKALTIAVQSDNENLVNELQKYIKAKSDGYATWGAYIYDLDEATFYAWFQALTCRPIEKFSYIDNYAKVNRLNRSSTGASCWEKSLKLVNFAEMRASSFQDGPSRSDILTSAEKVNLLNVAQCKIWK